MDVPDGTSGSSANVTLHVSADTLAASGKCGLIDGLDSLLSSESDAAAGAHDEGAAPLCDADHGDTDVDAHSPHSTPDADCAPNANASTAYQPDPNASTPGCEAAGPLSRSSTTQCNGGSGAEESGSPVNRLSPTPTVDGDKPSRSRPGIKFRAQSLMVPCAHRMSGSQLTAVTGERADSEHTRSRPVVVVQLMRLDAIDTDVVERLRQWRLTPTATEDRRRRAESTSSSSSSSDEEHVVRRAAHSHSDGRAGRKRSRSPSHWRDTEAAARKHKMRRLYAHCERQPTVDFRELMRRADEKQAAATGKTIRQTTAAAAVPPPKLNISFKKIGVFKASASSAPPPPADSTPRPTPAIPSVGLGGASAAPAATGGSAFSRRLCTSAVPFDRRPRGAKTSQRPRPPVAGGGRGRRSPSPTTKAALAARHGAHYAGAAAAPAYAGDVRTWAADTANWPAQQHYAGRHGATGQQQAAGSPSPTASYGHASAATGSDYAAGRTAPNASALPMPHKPKVKPSTALASGISHVVEALSDSDDDELVTTAPTT